MAVEILITGDYRDRDIKRAHRDLDLLGQQSTVTGAAFTRMSAIGVGMGAAVGAAAIQAASGWRTDGTRVWCQRGEGVHRG